MSVPPRLQVLVDKARPGFAHRAAQRKSPLHMLKIPLLLVLFPFIWWRLGLLMWQLAQFWHPDLRAIEFLGPNFNALVWQVGGQRTLGAVLLLLPLMPLAIGCALIVLNLGLGLMRPVARIFEREAAGDPELTERGATLKLISYTLRHLLPLGLALSLIGAAII